MAHPPGAHDVAASFLPNFCNIRVVFAVIIIAELLAFVLTLAQPGDWDSGWGRLSLTSLFIQWVALASMALLCALRPWLARYHDTTAGGLSYALILFVTWLISETAYWLGAEHEISTLWRSGFVFRNLAISAIVSAITLRYFYVQHQRMRGIEAESVARMQALQSRIRPHFLFNSLNTIAALTRSNPAAAEEAVEDLADLFRESLSEAQACVPLSDELDLTRRYLRIEGLRLGARLHVVWEIDGVPLDTAIPALTLQPLIENAIYHGIEPLLEGGTVRIHGVCRIDRIEFTVSNPLSTEHIHLSPTRRARNGMALDNIRQRLAVHYGERGTLTTHVSADRYEANLVLPLIQEVR